MQQFNAKRVRFSLDASGQCLQVYGFILEDGRVITKGTGLDGGDSLWASLAAYKSERSPARVVACDDLKESAQISLKELRAADCDNRYYGESLLKTSEWFKRYGK